VVSAAPPDEIASGGSVNRRFKIRGFTFYVADPISSVPDYSQVYGTRKNFPVYGSFTTDPDAKLVTSIYLPSSGV
jgi:hypothetical protein